MTDRLGAFAVLEELGASERGVLGEHLVERETADEGTLFVAGEEASELLFVLEGRVRLERDGESLGTLGPGELIGGVSLVAIGLRECAAVAEGCVRVLALSREGYLRLRASHPAVALALQEAVLRSFASTVRASIAEAVRGDPGSA
jgi:CRP-like cAMP-binding protein